MINVFQRVCIFSQSVQDRRTIDCYLYAFVRLNHVAQVVLESISERKLCKGALTFTTKTSLKYIFRKREKINQRGPNGI